MLAAFDRVIERPAGNSAQAGIRSDHKAAEAGDADAAALPANHQSVGHKAVDQSIPPRLS
ncbi:hypothetical protein [Methylobacterium tardum]|uniref:Uncharacterized protein n=1 Tax=Methylobacterium tardum TaxID=374432 RepID=A0AA37WV28_9HYPH|nr:hypothetical protein [Methylobacterium tardum]URD40268.1 hypothetical protein M6G65_33265 [Methylobacterium tardum]GLS74605.1 hypothetical protein GCM10007890_66230 [Methylobacterium tardum]